MRQQEVRGEQLPIPPRSPRREAILVSKKNSGVGTQALCCRQEAYTPTAQGASFKKESTPEFVCIPVASWWRMLDRIPNCWGGCWGVFESRRKSPIQTHMAQGLSTPSLSRKFPSWSSLVFHLGPLQRESHHEHVMNIFELGVEEL
jgi:hypothetical protein